MIPWWFLCICKIVCCFSAGASLVLAADSYIGFGCNKTTIFWLVLASASIFVVSAYTI